MTLSANEFQSLVKRAGVGAGLATGLAEDVAEAALWLHRNGGDGARTALAALTSFAGTPAEEVCVAATDAPSAVDRVLAGLADEAILKNVDAPELVVGLAGARTVGAEGALAVISVADGAIIQPTASIARGTDLAIRRAPATAAATAGEPVRRIHIDQAVYDALLTFANKTLVAATEASRRFGAGAGLTDAD